MGMITRVRARLQSFSITHKLNVKAQDEKHSRNVCLLSTILLLPYFLRFYSPFLVSCLGAVYSCLVLPMVLSSWPMIYALEVVETAKVAAKGFLWQCGVQILDYLKRIYKHIDRLECGLIQMRNLSTIYKQIVFFMLADQVFCPDYKLSCLYSLMFYNVIAYCVSYVKHLVSKEDWCPYVHISRTTNVKHLAMSTVKITLEFTKAVTFIITVVFMLLVFGLEQGLENYKPSWTYLTITGLYYIITEKVFAESFPGLLEFFSLEVFESLESLWGPVILKAATIAASTLFTLPALYFGNFKLVLLAAYVNIYLCYKDLLYTAWTPLDKERACLARYRYATMQEVKERDDVCSVCLQSMRFARVTPCNHMFHGDCLRRCLKERNLCPMCKYEL